MLSPWLKGRRVLGVELLSGGLMNRNCRLHLDDAGEPIVLRLYDRDPETCTREVAILNLVRRDVPVPSVLYAEPKGDDHNPPFVVLQFVDGISLRDLMAAGGAAVAEAAYDAGRVLSRLQAYGFPQSGLLTGSLTVDSSFIAGPIATVSLIQLFARSESFSRRVSTDLLRRVYQAAQEWDDNPAVPEAPVALVHGDFNSRNIIVRRLEGKWSVAAVLDWEFAFAGRCYCDVGNFLRYERAASPRFEPFFSRGCQDGGIDLSGDWRAAARMADLPALCELLARPALPDSVAAEILALVAETLAELPA